MTLADIYTRKSKFDENRSVASQEAECRDDVGEQGWQVGRVFVDPDKSASRFARKPRPDYEQLVTHIAAGQCQTLVLWEASRGSRDLADWVALIDLCRKQHTLIRVTAHRRTYDVRNRRDWRTLAEEGVDAHDEAERLSERTKRGKRAAALAGLPFGQLLYGYARVYDERGRYVEQVVNEDQGEVIREVAQRILAGEALAAIARDLNGRGIPSPEGGIWRGSFLGRMVRNPAYVAQRVHQGEVVGPARWPAILDEGTWLACCALLSDPHRRTQRGTELRWFLSGVPICGRCGGRLRTFHGGLGRRYLCQRCRRTLIQADALDEYIEGVVLARLRTSGFALSFAPPSNDTAMVEARRERATLQARLDAHYGEAADGRLSAAGLAAVESRLLGRIADLSTRVRRLSMPPAVQALAGIDVPGTWGDLSARVRRDVVTALCEIHVAAAVRGLARFDRRRLGGSRWAGEQATWGELGVV